MNRICIYILLALTAFVASAQEAVDRFLTESGVNPDKVALLITDLSDGKVIESYNIDASLIPASIMKSVTIATLLEKKGPDYRYTTNVYLTAPVRNGVVNGNLVVVGSGDPSVNVSCEPKSEDFVQEIVDALVNMKVEEVRGRIVVDGGIFGGPSVPQSWQSGDLPHSYGTGTHGFNFEGNACGKRSVSNPSSVFESRLRSALSARGITVTNESVRQGEWRRLIDHKSPTIDEIMRSCMMRSDNMMAESMLRTYSVENGGDGSTADGATREAEWWSRSKAPMDGVTIIDGSGLSRSNRVTARFMEYVLRTMSDDAIYASFFPLAGQEGTLKRFLADTPLDSYVALKTGSMRGIQCYAGYKLDDDYAPTHTVVVIVNEMIQPRDKVRGALQKLLLSTFEQECSDKRSS